MTLEFVLPEAVKVRFSNSGLLANEETTGFLRAEPDGLVIEFQVVEYDPDSLWPTVIARSAVREAPVPLAEIESITLKEGWVQTTVEIKTRSLKPLAEIPGARHGQLSLCIHDKDRAAAKELVSTTTLRVSEHHLQRFPTPGAT